MRKQFRTVFALIAFCGFVVQTAAAGVGTEVIDNITNRYSNSAESWILSIQGCGAPHCFVGNGVKVFCIERGYVVTLFRGLQTEIVPEVLTDRVKEPNRRGASVVERF